jgi:hypothetical protein
MKWLLLLGLAGCDLASLGDDTRSSDLSIGDLARADFGPVVQCGCDGGCGADCSGGCRLSARCDQTSACIGVLAPDGTACAWPPSNCPTTIGECKTGACTCPMR